MRLTSKLKRAKYASVALVLLLTSIPVVPLMTSENVFAAQYTCASDASDLLSRFGWNSNNRTASLCSNISNMQTFWGNEYKGTITAYGDSVLELTDGHVLTSNISTSTGYFNGTLRIFGEGTIDGTLGGNLTIEGGTYTVDPTQYVDTDQYEVYHNQTTGTWTVAAPTMITANDVSIMEGESAQVFTVTPAAYVSVPATGLVVSDETGAPVTDGVEITTKTENGAIVGTAKGLESGSYTLTITTNNGHSATVNIVVVSMTSVEKYVKVGEDVNVVSAVEVPEGATVVVENNNKTIANYDSSDIYTITGYRGGDATIAYTVSDATGKTISIVKATIHVYDVEIANESFQMMEGTSINLNDTFIGEFENADAIEAELEGEGASTLSGNTVADGVFTAGQEDAIRIIKFYIGEGNDRELVGQVEITVFSKPTLSAQLLSVSGRGAEQSALVDLENVPEYTLATSGDDIVEISGDSENGYTLTAANAGKATVTVTYDGAYGAPTQEFVVRVSDFHTDARNNYTVNDGDTVEFTVSEEYRQSEISCMVDGVDCEESEAFDVEKDESGKYTITVKEAAHGGRHTFVFTDAMLPNNNTVSVVFNVHEIVIEGETEQYLPVNTLAQITVSERTNQGYIRAQVVSAEGGTTQNANVLCIRNGLLTGSSYTCSLQATRAGKYTIRITNTERSLLSPFGPGEVYDTEDIVVYAFDFKVEDMEYHVSTKENTQKLINAINTYWKNTVNSEVEDVDGEVATDFVISKATTGSTTAGEKYYFWPADIKAGEYTVGFTALVNGKEMTDYAKTVTIYVYDMVSPEETEYYGEMNGSNEFDVKVADKINDTVADMAKIDYTVVTEGDASGITVDVENGKVTVNKPGKYVVKYADTMNHGNGGLVGEYTATFEVFNLEADAPKGQFIDLGDAYKYTIDPTNTYGDIEVVITRTDENGNTTEISRTTTTYPNDGEGTFEFTPEEEGKYTVRIENLSAKEHDFREVEKGDFYVIAREYDFKLVRSGTPVEITSNSIWSVDSARDSYNPESLTVEDGKVTLDTSDMELGVRTVTLYHKFGKGQKEALKRVTIAIYDTVVESTVENAEVIDGTIDDLFSKVEELTNDPETLVELQQKIMDAIAQAVADGEEVDFETIMDTVNDILNENSAFGKAQEMFGPEWQNTIDNLNEAVAYGDVIRTRVNVEETIPEDEVRAEILDVLLPYDVDNVDYYDVTVEMYVTYEGDEGEEEYSLGLIHKLNGKITVALVKTTDPETGYTRTYYVVRMHDGEEPEVLVEGEDFYIEDGMIYVVSDKFSTYAVAYRDDLIPAKAPNTGSNTESIEGSVSQNTLSVAIAVMLTLAISLGAFGVEMATRKR